MDYEPQRPESELELHELRCLHELARQLLPLQSHRDVARDGLLCIAGITAIGSGALYWRSSTREAFELLSHFGLQEPTRSPLELEPSLAERLLTKGPLRWTGRGRRDTQDWMRGLAAFPEAWLLPLVSAGQLRGLLCLGTSLVTATLEPQPHWLLDLAETLRLALLGRDASLESPDSSPVMDDTDLPVSQRLAHLRDLHPPARDLVGQSASTLRLLEEIVSLADTDYTVMIHGETGTGKELAASLLHRLSKRNSGPFEAVDCSSIPRELIESELFGHVKGAFTGASRDFKGAFERADGGTLLLDEIGDMDLRSQTRLLRVLQEGKVRRLGGDQPIPVDVRVVAATNRDLVSMVRSGAFREDLYYRIHVCPLILPSLRERQGDSLVLFDHFMQAHAAELHRSPRHLTQSARERLQREEFPGNVRQLQNIVRRLLVRRAESNAVDEVEIEKALTHLGPVKQLATVEEQVAEPVADIAAKGPAAAESAAVGAESSPGDDPGAWVLQQLRQHRFNFARTAKALQARREAGASREEVPVLDRGALDYYLCGEFFLLFVAREFDLKSTVEELAAHSMSQSRLERKARAFLAPIQKAGNASKEEILRKWFLRIPERYHLAVGEAIDAYRSGRWRFR